MRPIQVYQDASVDLWQGDVREVLLDWKNLDETQVDLVIADPPYQIGAAEWDGSEEKTWADILPDLLRLPGDPCVLWFGAASRISVDLGAFSDLGLPPDRVLIWAPSWSTNQPQGKGRIHWSYHPLYLWRPPGTHEGPVKDVIRVPTTGGIVGWDHKGTKPLPLIKLLAGFAPRGGLIFSPFVGSGTDLVAAKDTGRRAIGVEINPDFCKIAIRRLAQEVLL